MNKLLLLACMLAVALAVNCDSSKCRECAKDPFKGKKAKATTKKCKKSLSSKKKKNKKKRLACAAYRFCVIKENAKIEAARNKQSQFCVTDRNFCRDQDRFCVPWARAGQCISNADWMLINCPRSCCPVCTGENTLGAGFCPRKDRQDQCVPDRQGPGVTCSQWAATGECKKNKDYMLSNCMQSCCKECQQDSNGCPTVKSKCKNRYNDKKANSKCKAWAVNGECQRNAAWMWKNCASECCPACAPRNPQRQNADPRAAGIGPVGFGGYGGPGGNPYGGFRG